MAKQFMLRRFVITVLLLMAGCVGAVDDVQQAGGLRSGLQKGDDIIPWNPVHVAGPNAGTNACPVCTYEARPAVLIFMKDGPLLSTFIDRLENLVGREDKQQLKGFIVVVDRTPAELREEMRNFYAGHIGICALASDTRDADLKEYRIDPSANITIMIYKDYKIAANFVDLRPEDFGQVEAAVEKLK